MNYFKQIPILAHIYLFLGAALRLVLWYVYGRAAGIGTQDIPNVLLVGLVQDGIALLFITLPFALFETFPDKVLKSHLTERISNFVKFLLIFGVLFLFPAEILFFDEFNSRFNLVAVDYFAYPTEVVGNIRESYPIPWLITALLILTYLIWNRIREIRPPALTPWKFRLIRLVCQIFLVSLFIEWGSVETLVKNPNRVKSQIAQNGILTFGQALYTNNIEFNHFYTILDENEAYKILRMRLSQKGGEFVSPDLHNLTRRFPPKPTGLGKLNVVIIGEESLGAQYTGALGDARGLTPNFDRISKEGLLFENAYATGTRTVRGLEAISMSFPPIPSESTVKRPGNEDMANLGQLLKNFGYHSSFLYGGFGAFDNMNEFFGNNGFELSDRLDVEKVTFSNIWGICDEDLFDHAVNYFDKIDQSKQPFFSIIMTTSNHKPFTFRPGIPGIPESGGGRDMGVKYADFALGKFFDNAKNKSWYKNTIFVVLGDHDSRVYGKAQIPVERFTIAMMILAPGHLTPRRVPNVTSQIDIAPTIMGLLGFGYEAPFYGRDILEPNAPLSQAVLVNHNHDVGLFKDNILAVTSLNQQQHTYRYTEADKTVEIPLDMNLQNELTAYIQTAYLQYRDKKYKLSNSRLNILK